jgi:uncharacterized RDD family membrane protein YckC
VPPPLEPPTAEELAAIARVDPRRVLRVEGRTLALAGFGWRLAGWAIDVLTLWVALGVVSGFWASGTAPEAQMPTVFGDVPRDLFLVGSAVQLAYHWVCNSIGWSAGKRVMGLRLVTAQGLPPGAVRGFVRTAVSLVSQFLWIGYVWAAWDARRQTWHDKVAGTYVVRLGEERRGSE